MLGSQRYTGGTPAPQRHGASLTREFDAVRRPQLVSSALVALVALAVGFLIAGQVKAQLLTPSNAVARNQALIRSVQDLERTNDADRQKIAALRAEIAALEARAAGQSATTAALRDQVSDLRAHAGLTVMHGPGVEVDLMNGVPSTDPTGQARYLVNYQDVQDVVNLLFAAGAEGVAVSGRRLTPISSFSGSEGEVVVDQGHRANESLDTQINALNQQVAALQSGGSGAADQQLAAEANQLRMLEGLVPVQGPGIVFTLDASGLTAVDLQDAINELMAGGGEAIEVNVHRVIEG